jgi:predicted phage terminase large subunit-like protein
MEAFERAARNVPDPEALARILEKTQRALRKAPQWQVDAFNWEARWLTSAHDYQLTPEGDWNVFLMLAGRGAGKTKMGANTIGLWAWNQPKTRWLISAPTSGDLRDVVVEGESGLIREIPESLIKEYNRSLHEIVLINDSIIKGIPGSEPSRYRGFNVHGAWFDELAMFEYLDDAWSVAQLSIRLGTRTRVIATTTPKPKDLIKQLLKRNLADPTDVQISRATTYQNLDNLAENFRNEILSHEGTKFGRQEIYAEIIDPEESGIIKRSWFKLWPRKQKVPALSYVVQSYDCAASEKTVNDPTACTTWGVFKPSDDAPWSLLLLDAWTDYMAYPELRKRILADYKAQYESGEAWKSVDLVLVEAKSAGIGIIQDLQRAGAWVRAYNPGKLDKVQRLNVCANMFQQGRIYVPESMKRPGQPRDWADETISQLCSFPESNHDDLVDATSQALRILRDLNLVTTESIPLLPEDIYADDVIRKGNPYAQ